MGFYRPNQLVQDARRHQVVVLPSDAMISHWEAGLEPQRDSERPAVRLGLNQIKGLSKAAALRIECARRQQAISCVQDLAVRSAERGVGKECGGTCRCRWSPSP